MKVYLLEADQGMYDDSRHWVQGVFSTVEAAQVAARKYTHPNYNGRKVHYEITRDWTPDGLYVRQSNVLMEARSEPKDRNRRGYYNPGHEWVDWQITEWEVK